MPKKKWLPYVRARYYRNRSSALAEAKRLRMTGYYRANVRKTIVRNRLPWTLWTSRLEQ